MSLIPEFEFGLWNAWIFMVPWLLVTLLCILLMTCMHAFEMAKEVAGKKPDILITDGLPAYQGAYMKEFWTLRNPRTQHIRHIKIKGDKNNNKMERSNGEIRDREKVMRGLKKEDTPILKGYQIFHNYIREHEGLEGKTPAEACGITIEGKNK